MTEQYFVYMFKSQKCCNEKRKRNQMELTGIKYDMEKTGYGKFKRD